MAGSSPAMTRVGVGWVWEPCHTLLVMRGLDPRILLGGAVKIPAGACRSETPAAAR